MVLGRLEWGRSMVPEEIMVAPVDVPMVMGGVVGCVWWMGALSCRKWLVQPVSARKSGWDDSGEDKARLTAWLSTELPRSHSGLLATDPPKVLARVASDLWPGAGERQVALVWVFLTR